jgi:predicted TIM-barrel fold metal-dependent hydrolase
MVPLNRRHFIGGLAATPALFYGVPGSSQPADATQRRRRIDVHHHLLPPPYVSAMGDALRRQAPDFAFVLDQWSPARSIDEMNKYGVASAITSLSTPGVFSGDVPAARALARACNDYAAGMAHDYPGRFGLFATLPMPDVPGSLAEVAYALDMLKADGIGLLTDYGDKWLGDPAFAALFDELNRRKAVVFVHPSVANCCRTLLPNVPPAVVEFVFDTTRTIVSLLYSGTFARCPDIKFIFPQDGGTMPMVSERIAKSLASTRGAAKLPDDPMLELQRLYFDIATSTSAPALRSLLAFTKPDHIMFGTDYPFLPVGYTADGLDKAGLAVSDQAAINRTTATRLLPRFA